MGARKGAFLNSSKCWQIPMADNGRAVGETQLEQRGHQRGSKATWGRFAVVAPAGSCRTMAFPLTNLDDLTRPVAEEGKTISLIYVS